MAGVGEGAAVDENNTLVDKISDLGSRIRVSLDFLCKNSTNLQEVLVYLFSHGLLSQRESQVVENQLSDFDGFYKLFNFIIQKLGHGDNSQHFLDALQRSGNEHIVEKLKNVVVSTDPRYPVTSSFSFRFNVREPVSSFVGRNNFLRDLHRHILQSHPTAANVIARSTIISRICVVTGLGGIGKTETIRMYIHSYGHCYQHVVWIDAGEQNKAENQFRRLALELQLPPKDIDNKAKDLDFILKDVYERLCTKHTLIVLDNAEVLHDSDPQRTGVSLFLPASLPHTLIKPVVLITSRQQEWPDLQPMPLPLWTPQESSEFVLRQLQLDESDANRKDAEMLSETFDGLPPALQAAAAVIRKESKANALMGKDVYSIQHLLSDYNKGKRKVLKNSLPGSPDTPPLMLLWKESLDKIRPQPNGDLAADVLNVVAHLSPTNIPKKLLFFIFSSNKEKSIMEAVSLLVDYSFLHSSSHFSIHRVLQDVTLAHLELPSDEHSQNRLMNFSCLLRSRRRSNSTLPLIRITTGMKTYWPTLSPSSEAYDAAHDNLVHVTMSHVLPKAHSPAGTDLHFVEFIIEFVLKEIKDTRRKEVEKCCRVLIPHFTSWSFFKSPNFVQFFHLRRQLARILKTMDDGEIQGN